MYLICFLPHTPSTSFFSDIWLQPLLFHPSNSSKEILIGEVFSTNHGDSHIWPVQSLLLIVLHGYCCVSHWTERWRCRWPGPGNSPRSMGWSVVFLDGDSLEIRVSGFGEIIVYDVYVINTFKYIGVIMYNNLVPPSILKYHIILNTSYHASSKPQ